MPRMNFREWIFFEIIDCKQRCGYSAVVNLGYTALWLCGCSGVALSSRTDNSDVVVAPLLICVMRLCGCSGVCFLNEPQTSLWRHRRCYYQRDGSVASVALFFSFIFQRTANIVAASTPWLTLSIRHCGCIGVAFC